MCLPITLGEDHGSGHCYLAKNRTFLLCVDTNAPAGMAPLAGTRRLHRVILRASDEDARREPHPRPHRKSHIFAHFLSELSRFDLTTSFVCNRCHAFLWHAVLHNNLLWCNLL